MILRPNEPGNGKDDKQEQIRPMEQEPEPEARFAKKNGQERANAAQIKNRERTSCETGEAAAEPKHAEPSPAKFAERVSADKEVDSSRGEKSEEGIGANHPPEEKAASRTKMTQPGDKAAPISGQAFPDKEDERDGPDHRERDRDARSRRRYS